MGLVADVVAKGDERASLEALRDRLAGAVDICTPRELAGLSKQLAEVLKMLAGLPGEEKSNLDDLAARRGQRRASVQKRPAGGVQRGKRSG